MVKNTAKETSGKQKIYWCQCSRDIAKYIKRGSVPLDTGLVCPDCGGRIFEEEAKNNNHK